MTAGYDVRTRSVHIDWESAYEQHGAKLRAFESLISNAEKTKGLELTPSAIELLFVPLVDELDEGREIEASVLSSSIDELFDALDKSPDPRDHGQVRSAVSIIRAWHLRWCKSPPFCSKP